MAEVAIPILGADFLCANEIIVNMTANKLVWPKGMIPLSVASLMIKWLTRIDKFLLVVSTGK